MTHILQLPGSLSGCSGTKISKFPFKAVSRPSDLFCIFLGYGLSQLLQYFGRFLEENLTQLAEKLLVTTQSLQGLGLGPPGFWSFARTWHRRRQQHPGKICQHFLDITEAHRFRNVSIHTGLEAAFAIALHSMGGHGEDL